MIVICAPKAEQAFGAHIFCLPFLQFNIINNECKNGVNFNNANMTLAF